MRVGKVSAAPADSGINAGLWALLPGDRVSACEEAAAAVYRVDGDSWDSLTHRCEMDEQGRAWTVSPLTGFGTYVITLPVVVITLPVASEDSGIGEVQQGDAGAVAADAPLHPERVPCRILVVPDLPSQETERCRWVIASGQLSPDKESCQQLLMPGQSSPDTGANTSECVTSLIDPAAWPEAAPTPDPEAGSRASESAPPVSPPAAPPEDGTGTPPPGPVAPVFSEDQASRMPWYAAIGITAVLVLLLILLGTYLRRRMARTVGP